jgi:hypothetical protein
VVSTVFSRSLLVTIWSGKYEPVPVIRAKVIRNILQHQFFVI